MIDNIFSEIAQEDERLGKLFKDIMERLNLIREKIEDREKFQSVIQSEIKKEVGRLAGSINLIPSSRQGRCRKYCLSLAFNKWASKSNKKPGFKVVADKTIDYWLACSNVNRGTIIFTSAWDEVDFQSNYLNSFSNYSKQPNHTVAIVLVTPKDVSLQYLR